MSSGNDRERHLELLLGRRVQDADGRAIGRIEEFHAEKEGDYYVVAHVDLGPVALLERLAVRHLGVTWSGRPHGYRARWDQIDFEDDAHLVLTAAFEELEEIRPPKGRHRTR
jgi:hypothetical protein